MAGAGSGESRAQAETEASPWHEAAHSRIRLLSASGLRYQGKPVLAAIEIVLEKGWKTYWYAPGEGLPPSLDWSASRNLAEATALWPAPSRIRGPEGTSLVGYAGQVLLPVLVTPKDASLPINLSLSINYSICAEICIPLDAILELEIPLRPQQTYQDRIRAALNQVPKPQEQGVYCPHSFIAARWHSMNGSPALVIKTAFEENTTGLELFVEAPEGLSLPAPVRQPPSTRGRSHYVIFFDTQAAVDALLDKTLTLTTVSDQGSCVSTWPVK